MAAGQMEVAEGGGVGPQLVGHNQPGREALLSEQCAHQLQGSPPVSLAHWTRTSRISPS
jgi:hypothetical protein